MRTTMWESREARVGRIRLCHKLWRPDGAVAIQRAGRHESSDRATAGGSLSLGKGIHGQFTLSSTPRGIHRNIH